MQLFASARSEELAMLGLPPAQMDFFVRMQFQLQSNSHRTAYPRAKKEIILRHGEPIGVWLVNRSAEEMSLVDIVLRAEARGGGLGRQLVESLLAEAASAGVPVRLQVATNNRAARLYLRLGFVCLSRDLVYAQLEWRAPQGDGQALRAETR